MTLPVVLADIDGTLVHSRRKCADIRGAVVAEVYDGRDVGFISPTGWNLLAELQALSVFVPATARTISQYSRIRFPSVPPVAVVAAGGVILVDGIADPVWSAATQEIVDSTSATVEQVVAQLGTLPVAEQPRNGDGCFGCVKVVEGSDISDFERWCSERDWRVVRQDERIYVLPRQLSKAAALPRLAEIVGARPVMALGDGLMDVEMMLVVEHRISPAGGAIWQADPHIATAAEGLGLTATEAVLRLANDCLRRIKAANKA